MEKEQEKVSGEDSGATLEVNEGEESLPQPKKKRKSPANPWKKPKDMPKRPLSAYNLFFKDERERLKSMRGDVSKKIPKDTSETTKSESSPATQKKDDGPGLGFAKLAQTIAAKWKVLDNETKAPYERQAAVDKERYDKAVAIWRDQQARKKQAQQDTDGHQQDSLDSELNQSKPKSRAGSSKNNAPGRNSPSDHTSTSNKSYPQDWFEAASDDNVARAQRKEDGGNTRDADPDLLLLAPTSPLEDPWTCPNPSQPELLTRDSFFPNQRYNPSNYPTQQISNMTGTMQPPSILHNEHPDAFSGRLNQTSIFHNSPSQLSHLFHNNQQHRLHEFHVGTTTPPRIIHNPFLHENYDGTPTNLTQNYFRPTSNPADVSQTQAPLGSPFDSLSQSHSPLWQDVSPFGRNYQSEHTSSNQSNYLRADYTAPGVTRYASYPRTYPPPTFPSLPDVPVGRSNNAPVSFDTLDSRSSHPIFGAPQYISSDIALRARNLRWYQTDPSFAGGIIRESSTGQIHQGTSDSYESNIASASGGARSLDLDANARAGEYSSQFPPRHSRTDDDTKPSGGG